VSYFYLSSIFIYLREFVDLYDISAMKVDVLIDLHWVRALTVPMHQGFIDGPFEVDVLISSVCNLFLLVPQLKCWVHIWSSMRAVCSVHHSPLYVIIHITKSLELLFVYFSNIKLEIILPVRYWSSQNLLLFRVSKSECKAWIVTHDISVLEINTKANREEMI